MPVDEVQLAKFVGAVKQGGVVSIEELRRAFPIDTMGAEDIAAIVLHLEEAGVSVDIDPSLFTPRDSPSLRPLGPGRAQPSPATISTESGSRVPSCFEMPRSDGSSIQEKSAVDYSSVEPSTARSGGKRMLFVLVILAIIAVLAIWGLSKI